MGEEDSEYEIVPHKEIIDLKNELKGLRDGGHDSGISFHTSIDNLQLTINSLLDVFREASRGLKIEQDHQADIMKRIDDLNDKIATILSQNEKIAEGIVAVADMVKEAHPAKEDQPGEELPERPPMRPFGTPPASPFGNPSSPFGSPPMPPPMPPPMMSSPRAFSPMPGSPPQKRPMFGR